MPRSILLGRPWPAVGEPLFLPEDRAELHALWAWRSEHCGRCGQRRADWHDERGIQLRDPPFEVRAVECPSCELLHDWEHDEEAKKDRRPGTHPYFARLDDEDDEDDDGG